MTLPRHPGESVDAVLLNDLQDIDDRLDNDDSPINRRIFVRALFAFFESHLFNMREAVIFLMTTQNRDLREPDLNKLVLLSAQEPLLKNSGKLGFRPNRQRFAPLAAFTLRTFAEEMEVDPAPIFSHSDWPAFGQAVTIRNRITHPRKDSDVIVSDNDLAVVRRAHQWFLHAIRAIHSWDERLGGN